MRFSAFAAMGIGLRDPRGQWLKSQINPSLLGGTKERALRVHPALASEFPPADEWGVDEWREYALLQQDLAEHLCRELMDERAALARARKNLSRRKKPRKGTLLTPPPEGKPGRPRGRRGTSRVREVAEKVLAFKVEYQKTTGKNLSNSAAIDRYLARLGPTARNNLGVAKGSIRNALARLHMESKS